MNYQQCLDYVTELENKNYLPDHANSLRLMAQLGNPQDAMPVIHVAGTNGKGSTIAYMASVYRAAGYSVGTFTSPHILSLRELVTINGAPVGEAAFAKAMTLTREACEDAFAKGCPHPTVFEFLTAAALLCLSNSNLDIAIIEVGMGGRYDATNVFKAPLLTVITRIALDHTKWLGESLKDIAYHKGGIIKASGPTILAPNDVEVNQVISSIVRESGLKLYLMDEGFIHEKVLMVTRGHKLFHLSTNFFDYKALRTSMLGEHQIENLSTALLAIKLMQDSFPVNDEAVKNGIQSTKWTCRCELVSRDPLIMVDGGHNPNALMAMKGLLEQHFSDKEIITVMGVLQDKDYEPMLEKAATFSDRLILTAPLSPRAALPSEIKTKLNLEAMDDYTEALEKALSYKSDRTLILVIGSLYLAYPAKEWLLGKGLCETSSLF